MRRAIIVVGLLAAVAGGCKTGQTRAAESDGKGVAAGATPTNSAPGDTTRGLRVGDQAPDATLSTSGGRLYQLDDIIGGQPTVLIFYRGGWCPFCAGELQDWQEHIEEVRALGAEVIAITPEAPEQALGTASKHELGFTVLSDVRGEAAKAFDLGFTLDEATQKKYKGYGIDLAESNAMKNWDLVIPATYVVDSSGVIRYAYVNEDYKQRADAEDVIEVLRQVR